MNLIVMDKKEHIMKLLELGGKSMSDIITEMPINKIDGQVITETRIEALAHQSNFCIQYERYSDKFVWCKYDQQRQYHFTKNN